MVVDDTGTAVRIPALPERVISLSPANTEIVFALGAGDRLVGGTDFDDYPPEAAALPDVASYTGVLMEQVVAARAGAGARRWQRPDPAMPISPGCVSWAIPSWSSTPETVDGVLDDIRLIGDALGGDAIAQADAVTAGMSAGLDRVAGLAAGDRDDAPDLLRAR